MAKMWTEGRRREERKEGRDEGAVEERGLRVSIIRRVSGGWSAGVLLHDVEDMGRGSLLCGEAFGVLLVGGFGSCLDISACSAGRAEQLPRMKISTPFGCRTVSKET